MAIPPIPPALPGLPKVTGATNGDFATFTNNGSKVQDSGVKLDDTLTTNSALWSSAKIANYVTASLINVPTLPVVQAASTANLGLSGTAAVDGVTIVAGNYVLVKNQTTASQNGIYKVAAGAWIRQKYDTTLQTYQDVDGSVTTMGAMNINGGVTFVTGGTVGKNLQFQCAIPTPGAAYPSGSAVNWTSVTKLPISSTSNRFVDTAIGNNTTNNGSQSFPYATITQALTGAQYPLCITLSSSTPESSAVTWTSSNANTIVQGQTADLTGTMQTLGGVQTFASGGSRNDFRDVQLSTGSNTSFVFQSGYLFRNNLENITITSTAASWVSFPTNAQNWISFNNVQTTTLGLPQVTLPAFTNPFDIYVSNQLYSPLIFNGTGAANTRITITNCPEYFVQVPPTYVGQIVWQDTSLNVKVGSVALPGGIITSQAQLTTILSHTADTTYDGNYVISGFTPAANNFGNGDLFSKVTIAGVLTSTFWLRKYAYAPATISSIDSTVYQQAAGTSTWVVLGTNNLPGHQFPNTYYVDPVGGLDTNPGTYAQPWQTITKACTDTPADSIVYFAPGTYNPGALLTPVASNIVFEGFDRDSTIFQIDLTVTSTTITFQNVTINNGGTLTASSSGAINANDCEFQAAFTVDSSSSMTWARCIASGYIVTNSGVFTAVDCPYLLTYFATSAANSSYYFYNCERVGSLGIVNSNATLSNCTLQATNIGDCVSVNNSSGIHTITLSDCILSSNVGPNDIQPGTGTINFAVTGGFLAYSLNNVNYKVVGSAFSSATRATQPVSFDALRLGVPLPVASGGTNNNALAANGAMIMNSLGDQMLSLAPGAAGNLMTSNGTGWTSVAPANKVVTGTWSLPPGTSNQTITCPGNSTCTVSVIGNIPNGIITYNGTLTFSNANVAFLGYQVAWYYPGNALVWNQIPPGLVGANNLITNDQPATVLPTNVLRFQVTNNSGATQTVKWAYTVVLEV